MGLSLLCSRKQRKGTVAGARGRELVGKTRELGNGLTVHKKEFGYFSLVVVIAPLCGSAYPLFPLQLERLELIRSAGDFLSVSTGQGYGII